MKKRQTRLNVILLILILGIALTIFFDVKLFRESTSGFVKEHPYLMEEEGAEEVMIGSDEETEENTPTTGSTEETASTEGSDEAPAEPSGQSHGSPGAGIFAEIFGE